MRRFAKHFLMPVVLLGLPVTVFAQHAARPVGTSRPAALPRRIATGRPNPRTMNATTPPGNVAPYYNGGYGSWGGSSLNNLLGNYVPGLGFSYGAGGVNSLNQNNLGVEALINPATQAQIALALKFLRASPQTGFGGGLWALPEPYYEDYGDAAPPPEPDSGPSAPQQPSVIVVQAPAAQAAPPADEAAPPPAAATPETDGSGEFVLVKRDGTQITAGAFFHQENELVYITPSGARRTMPFSDLDVDATVLANQERGTDLQLPL